MTRIKDLNWVKKIISSCGNEFQLDSATQLACLYIKKHRDPAGYSMLLDDLLKKRQLIDKLKPAGVKAT